jgi:DNA polymerase-3 subunit gamma/tau
MEKFIVSARKYRPSTFDEVIGQNHISATLKNALLTDHVGHAYLFTGPRGVGKTTCARILAKVVNCLNPINKHTPCNTCDSCSSFNENASFNIIELDAASNNSVENIRMLVDQVRFQPQGGKYKVFIIDEVHMLSANAFNAFLKTLEEPPPHAIFILATTEKHKIIPTILSRCQIFDFRRISNLDIIKNLEQICVKENIAFDQDGLHVIAEKADGAMRDALSIFDRIVSSVGGKITYQDVITNLNILDHDYYFKMVDDILLEDLSNVLLTYNEISKNGFEGEMFINGFSDHLRQLMVAKDIQTLALLETSESLKTRYLDQASKTKLSFILSALNIANQCDINFFRAQNKELHVEIALSKMVFLERTINTGEQFASKKKPDSELTSPQKKAKLSQAAPTPVREETDKQEQAPEVNKKTDSNPPVEKPKSKSKLSQLKEEIRKELETDKKNTKVFTKEIAQSIIEQYIEKLTSPYVSTILKAIKFELYEKDLSIFVPSALSEDIVKQEVPLIEQIRGSMPDESFNIQIIVNPDLFPDYKELKPKKILNNKEKYELFQSKNTLVEKFVDILDLKIDAE